MFLDYDGTLTPIRQKPEEAILSPKEKQIITKLARQNSIQVVIVSGRAKSFLTKQFKGLPVDICSEHGALYYSHIQKKWTSLVQSDIRSWYGMASKIIKAYTFHVPESLIETKQYSISWHYRESPSEFASYKANHLKQELQSGLSEMPVNVLDGEKNS